MTNTITDKPKVLIVDDSTANIHFLGSSLADEYHIQVSNDGSSALELAVSFKPDIILLDIEMPGMNGYELCSLLKGRRETKSIPIIFISAHTEESEEILGLHLGAVDFIKRPYSIPIVKARVKAHLTQRQVSPQSNQIGRFRMHDWLVDPDTNRIQKDNQVRHLRGKAMELLVLLATHQGSVVSKEAIIEKVWNGNTYVGETALKATVWTIRQAFFEGNESEPFIENLPKKGYRLLPFVTWE